MEVDGKPQSITAVRCNDRTIDGRARILLTLRSSEQVEVRADGVVWYRSKVEGTPTADGGVQRFQAGRGAGFDVTLGGHHLTGAAICP